MQSLNLKKWGKQNYPIISEDFIVKSITMLINQI